MDFKTIDFRHFRDLKTNKIIKVRIRYVSTSEIYIYKVTTWNGHFSKLLQNYFNYQENQDIFQKLKNGHEIKVEIIEKKSNDSDDITIIAED